MIEKDLFVYLQISNFEMFRFFVNKNVKLLREYYILMIME